MHLANFCAIDCAFRQFLQLPDGIKNAYLSFEHTLVLHTSIINACSLAMVYVSPFVVSIVLFKTRKKIRVLEKSPLFARWKNKAKLAVITWLGWVVEF